MSSQEEIYSQETYDTLMSQLNHDGINMDELESCVLEPEWKIGNPTGPNEVVMVLGSPTEEHLQSAQNAPNEMTYSHEYVVLPPDTPISSPCEGIFGFAIDVPVRPGKPAKSIKWTYSPILKKVFAQVGMFWPVYLITKVAPPEGSIVRAMVQFKDKGYAQVPVVRCANHIHDDVNTPSHFVEHMVRCSNAKTQYEKSEVHGHNSCAVVYCAARSKDNYQTSEMYSLNCFSSCTSSLNRRPIIMIFTLEHNGIVYGRQELDVRICACPGRDQGAEETKVAAAAAKMEATSDCATSPNAQDVKVEPVDEPDQQQEPSSGTTTRRVRRKRRLDPDDDDKIYIIKTKSKKHYKMLLKMYRGLQLLDEQGWPSSSASESESVDEPSQSSNASEQKTEPPIAFTTRVEFERGQFRLRRTMTCPARI